MTSTIEQTAATVKDFRCCTYTCIQSICILHFVTGQSVDIVDVFRLDRYVTNDSSIGTSRKPHPVLVKLRAV